MQTTWKQLQPDGNVGQRGRGPQWSKPERPRQQKLAHLQQPRHSHSPTSQSNTWRQSWRSTPTRCQQFGCSHSPPSLPSQQLLVDCMHSLCNNCVSHPDFINCPVYRTPKPVPQLEWDPQVPWSESLGATPLFWTPASQLGFKDISSFRTNQTCDHWGTKMQKLVLNNLQLTPSKSSPNSRTKFITGPRCTFQQWLHENFNESTTTRKKACLFR